MRKMYVTGEMPESPIIRDVVYIIDNIVEVPIVEHEDMEGEDPQQTWSCDITEVISIPEYLKRLTDAQNTFMAETDDALFELDALYNGGE